MGIRAVIGQIVSQLQQTTATTDTSVPFRIIDDGAGACARLEDVAASGMAETRVCDVRITSMPLDDGAASAGSTLRYRTDLAVRWLYILGQRGRRTEVEILMAEDIAAVDDRLSDPSNWGAVGIDALITERSQASASLIADGAAAILSFPLTAIYWE